MMNLRVLAFSLIFIIPFNSVAQERHDKGKFVERDNKFYDETILNSINTFNNETAAPPKLYFKMDFSTIDPPKSADEFEQVWAGAPVSQGRTNTCWCFSTTSFYESEVKRLTGKEVRLSEQYIVYFETIQKALEFVRTRGASYFDEGSETNAVARMMKQYGMVPHESYTGYLPGQKFQDHETMFLEMKNYLSNVKSTSAWNPDVVEATIRSIMDRYMGKVPEVITVNGKQMTPLQYMNDILKLNPDDYVDFMSLMEKPYWQKVEYDVPDNWWNSEDYYNVPLDVFMEIVDKAPRNGYTLSIGGDVSEAGIMGSKGIAVVPTFDIPSAYIDENARQFRFTNGSTTDDHALHLVGWADRKDGTWYLIKDSGSGAHNNPVSKGYYYYHEDYVKLKMMSFTVHKDAVKEILNKFTARK